MPVVRDQAVAYLAMNAWSSSAGNNGYNAVSAALAESAAMLRGDHFVSFVNSSGILTLRNSDNVRAVRELHQPMAVQYGNYAAAAAAQTPMDTESATVFTQLGEDHSIMHPVIDRMFGGTATGRWPRPMTITQSDLYPGDPVAVGQARVDARLAATREAYFAALCGVASQYARMSRSDGLSLGLLAISTISANDFWRRLGTLTGVVAVDDAANLAAARTMVSALEASYTALSASATAAGDVLFASLVAAKLSDVQAIVVRLAALQIS